MIRELTDRDVVVELKSSDRIVVNGKYFELNPSHDKIYDDLKYIQFDGELWVEE